MRIGYLDNIGFTLLTYLITYIIGHVIFGIFAVNRESETQSEFTKNTLGLLGIIIVYSILKTSGITINVGFIILFTFYWLHNRPSLDMKFSLNLKAIFTQLLLLITIYTHLYLLLFGIKKVPYIWMMIDHTIYSTYIDKLNIICAEGIQSDFFFKEPVRNIYHFGELWYSAFFSSIYKHNTLQVFYFACFSNFLLTIILGGKAVLEKFVQPNLWYHWIFPFLLFFLSGIVFYFPTSIEFFSLKWGNDTILANIKYAPISIFLIWVFLRIFQKDYYNAVLLLLVIILINTSTAPSIFIGLVLFIGCLVLIKALPTRNAFSITLPVFSIGIFIIAYVVLISNLNSITLTNNITFEDNFSILDKLHNFLYYKTLFNCTIGSIIKFILSSAPFIILLLFVGKKTLLNNLPVFLFVFIFVCSSSLAYGIFNFEFDGTQFWTTIYIPLMSIFLFYILVLTHSYNSNIYIKIYATVVLFLLFYPRFFQKSEGLNFKQYTSSYHYLSDHIPANHKKEIAIFYPKSKPTQAAGLDRSQYYPYSYIKLYINNYHPYCLSEFDTILSDDLYIRKYQLEFLMRSVFYRYVEKQKMHKLFSSTEQSQLDFIKEADVKYILTQFGAELPKLIKPYVDKVITDTTSATLDKLYILKDFK